MNNIAIILGYGVMICGGIIILCFAIERTVVKLCQSWGGTNAFYQYCTDRKPWNKFEES